jgi:hypothetical protein
MDRHFFPKRFFANRSMMALLLATDEVHAQPVSVKHFCLKNSFFASLIIIKYKDTKGLAIINGAAMPPPNHCKATITHQLIPNL